MPRLLMSFVLLMGALLCLSAPPLAVSPVASVVRTVADHDAASIREVRARGGPRYYQPPVSRRPPPVYHRPPPRPPVPTTQQAPGAKWSGSSRPPVLGPGQRPKVFATPGRSGASATAIRATGSTAKPPPPRSDIKARLDKLPKQVGSGSGGTGRGSGGISKPPDGTTTGPPGGRPRLTQIHTNAASQIGGPAAKPLQLSRPLAIRLDRIRQLSAQNQKLVGRDYGSLGVAVRNPGIKIKGIAISHYFQRKFDRKMNSRDILNVIKNPAVILRQRGGGYLLLNKTGAVVVNKESKLVTAYSARQFDSKIRKILEDAGL